jgi:hypothetical protein
MSSSSSVVEVWRKAIRAWTRFGKMAMSRVWRAWKWWAWLALEVREKARREEMGRWVRMVWRSSGGRVLSDIFGLVV